jgi:hypothetical protein
MVELQIITLIMECVMISNLLFLCAISFLFGFILGLIIIGLKT